MNKKPLSTMFPFSREPKESPADTAAEQAAKAPEAHPLDALTGGVFSAATSGERAQRVRDWLASEPAVEHMQEVFKELSHKDKGAAKALRERLDDIKRASQQDAVAQDWADKAQALLGAARLNIADALAWQRDAAKAGAPLSREPLGSLRAQLVERIKKVEDLQQRVMVQREAAALLAQRIELLSTKPVADAEAQQIGLEADVAHWRTQAHQILADEQWLSVDTRYPPQLDTAQSQLVAVWDAFSAALAQTLAARTDSAAPLPPVPVWADELRAARGETPAAAAPEKPAKPKIDPEQRAAAQKAVETGVMLLEQAVTAGHTKNMHSATNALRQSLKAHGRLIDDALEARVHAALVSAGELEGWQRWSADKVREQLVAKAEALLVKRKTKGAPAPVAPAEPAAEPAAAAPAAPAEAAPAEVAAAPAPVAEAAPAVAEAAPVAAADGENAATETVADGAEPTSAEGQNDAPKAEPAAPALEPGFELIPAMGGRKLQDAIRKLREEWKTADQGGAPNHGLWKRFDRAINAAHKHVDEWITSVRAEAAEHKAQRQALIDEVKAWAQTHIVTGDKVDWKAFNRQIHQFSDRWRNAGHLSEKQYAELQPRWKETIHAAALPLETAQKQSTLRRQALIAEAEALGAAPFLRIDAVKDLQGRWQAEAQAVPLDRKFEQKLWDAFRKPLDDAFNRKGAQREADRAAMSALDKAVLDAAKALEAANASGDAQQIRAAMAALEAATRAQAPAADDSKPNEAVAPEKQAPAATDSGASAAADGAAPAATGEGETAAAGEVTEGAADAAAPADASAEPAAPAPAPAAPKRPVVAVRGDDRPGQKKDSPAAPAGRGGRPGDRRDARGGDRRPGGPGAPAGAGRPGDRGGRFGDRPGGDRFSRDDRAPRGPRLGDAAFRAQRDAVEHAQAALKKLAAQAHGETLTQLLGAWADRQPEQLPSTQELGRAITGSVRSNWAQALQSAPQGDASQALLRLEMAAEVPTPAEQVEARRALQLQLLTRRNEPGPRDTWADDAAKVLASSHNDAAARRLQNALKVLMRK
jgi:hypothetical protein